MKSCLTIEEGGEVSFRSKPSLAKLYRTFQIELSISWTMNLDVTLVLWLSSQVKFEELQKHINL